MGRLQSMENNLHRAVIIITPRGPRIVPLGRAMYADTPENRRKFGVGPGDVLDRSESPESAGDA